VFHRGWFQVAVRSPGVSEELLRVLTQYSTARIATAESAVWPELGQVERYAGVIAEVGVGFDDWCARIRSASPCLPVLAIVPRLDAGLFARLQARSIEVAVIPLHVPQLITFVQRSLASAFLPSDRVGRMVSFVAEARGLTGREVQLLSYCLADEPRSRVRRRLGISENTLKTQVKALLRKCGERNVDSLAKNVLRAALLAPSGQASAQPLAPWYPALSGAA
jgi:DNA-binding NarL/FixJ family response regulator